MSTWYCKNLDPILSHHQRAVGQPSLYWKTGEEITIYDIDGTSAEKAFFKNVYAQHFNFINLKYRFVDSKDADIRVSHDPNDGSWSTVGVECRNVPNNEPTMNIGWSGHGVIIHEGGHANGAHHEHMSPATLIDWIIENVVKDLSGAPNFWNLPTIQENVIDRLNPSIVQYTPFDKLSSQLYPLPKRWVRNWDQLGLSEVPNDVFSPMDKDFWSTIYPFEPVINPYVDMLRKIFLKPYELEHLTEGELVRMGGLIGCNAAAKLTKIQNLKLVKDRLFA